VIAADANAPSTPRSPVRPTRPKPAPEFRPSGGSDEFGP
jgi:hypothetical protein